MANHTLKPDPQVLARKLPGGAVLVHLETNRIFELNETSARVWDLMNDGLSREEIPARLAEEFEVDLGIAAAQVDDLLAELERAGLLNRLNESS